VAQDRLAVAVLTAPSHHVSLEPKRTGRLERLQSLAAVAPSAETWPRDILEDDSLRAGDVVMFPDGARVFAGDPRDLPHSERDFVPLSEASRLSARSRRDLATLAPSSQRVE
jgi:hypothetical protein